MQQKTAAVGNLSLLIHKQEKQLEIQTRAIEKIATAQSNFFKSLTSAASNALSGVGTIGQSNSLEDDGDHVGKTVCETQHEGKQTIHKVQLGSHDVVRTLKDVWDEWNSPWDNHESVAELNQKFGQKWRIMSPKEKKTYSRRKAVVELIQARSKGKDINQVIEDLEKERSGRAIATWIDEVRKRQRLA